MPLYSFLAADYPLTVSVVRYVAGHQTEHEVDADGETIYVSPGEAVELHCSVEGRQFAYSKLEWLDGRIPIMTTNDQSDTSRTLSSRRRLVQGGTCSTFLFIQNFTVYDYGDYRCRCVNDYTSEMFPLQDQLSGSNPIGPFCNKDHLIHLLPKGNQITT